MLYRSMAFDKCIISCIHHDSIMENNFIALKTPCAPPIINPSLPIPKPLATTFPECRRVRGMQYVAFDD